jgi:hypothetical protein
VRVIRLVNNKSACSINALYVVLGLWDDRCPNAGDERKTIAIRCVLVPTNRQIAMKISFPAHERSGLVTTLLGKSIINEVHPGFIGVYEGAMGREDVRDYIESSDCLILLGALLTDINLGTFTAHLDPRRCIHATRGGLRVGIALTVPAPSPPLLTTLPWLGESRCVGCFSGWHPSSRPRPS